MFVPNNNWRVVDQVTQDVSTPRSSPRLRGSVLRFRAYGLSASFDNACLFRGLRSSATEINTQS